MLKWWPFFPPMDQWWHMPWVSKELWSCLSLFIEISLHINFHKLICGVIWNPLKESVPQNWDARNILLAMNPHSFPPPKIFKARCCFISWRLYIFPQISLLWVRKNHHGPNPLSSICRHKDLSEMGSIFFPERPDFDLLLVFMSRISHCIHTNSTRPQRCS